MRSTYSTIGMWLLLALLCASCASDRRTMGHKEQSLPRWTNYSGDDAAHLYLRILDEVSDRERETLTNSGYDPASDYGARLVAIPRAQPTIIIDGKGRMRSFWGTSEVLLKPGYHEFRMQMRVATAPTVSYDPNAPREHYTDFPDIDKTLEAGHVYVLLLNRRGRATSDTTVYFTPLGLRKNIERLREIPNPLPQHITAVFRQRYHPKVVDAYRKVMVYVKNAKH
jgi:hypothetical protein